MSSDLDTTASDDVGSIAAPGRGVRVVLYALIVLALIAGAVVGGYEWGHRGSGSSTPSATSVDAGFARDMSTHHQQAITMAGYTRDNTDDPAIKVLAFDIESAQEFQVGEMQGWLDTWNLPREYPTQMVWMAGHAHVQANGLMPGMASPAQMAKLETLHGKALNIMFLQLMIHHHQGGIPMAQYAAQHATVEDVRNLAQLMVTAQSSEIVAMEQLLRQLGASPLPPPTE